MLSGVVFGRLLINSTRRRLLGLSFLGVPFFSRHCYPSYPFLTDVRIFLLIKHSPIDKWDFIGAFVNGVPYFALLSFVFFSAQGIYRAIMCKQKYS